MGHIRDHAISRWRQFSARFDALGVGRRVKGRLGGDDGAWEMV